MQTNVGEKCSDVNSRGRDKLPGLLCVRAATVNDKTVIALV